MRSRLILAVAGLWVAEALNYTKLGDGATVTIEGLCEGCMVSGTQPVWSGDD